MEKLILFLIGFVVVLNTSNAQEMVKESRKIESFTDINISSGIDLFIKQSNEEKISIEAPANRIDKLIIEVRNGALNISYKSSNGWSWGWNNGSNTKIFLTLKDLRTLNVSGGSDVVSENRILTDKLNINVSGGSDVKMEINTEKLNCNVSGGADVTLKGTAMLSNFAVSGGADLNAKSLKTQTSNVSCSGGADASVWAVENLKASASGGADIYYYGNPPKVAKASSGGGDIYKK